MHGRHVVIVLSLAAAAAATALALAAAGPASSGATAAAPASADRSLQPVSGTASSPTAAPRARHATRIRQPVTAPRVDTGRRDAQGAAITVACGTCHATSQPRRETRSSSELDEFHQGLQYAHGALTCLSCHDATNYDQLRLADGRGLAFADTMTLCAQCHGPQYRDYSHGSHGGMTGHWDLSRGPRERNHCVDCHDPHAPRYPEVQPAFPLPPDRGATAKPSAASRHE